MDILDWIRRELNPIPCTSDAFVYDDMESQSGRSLPIIYVPFDAGQRLHWRERGAAFDYLASTEAEGRRVLDFGPGDGWPSLVVAPYVAEVVGVDGSRRRVEVCTGNAARLGIGNARFVHVPPGRPLPFAAGSFDAVTAASSVEQTPDHRATLSELYRILRPGGRLRMHYEALGGYRGGREREAWLLAVDAERCRLVLFDRHVDEERAVQYGLTLARPASEVRAALVSGGEELSFEAIAIPGLEALRPALVDARVCTTSHPSGRTLVSWLGELGFREVLPTHNGIDLAGRLFDALPDQNRPRDLEGVDAYLRPIVRAVVGLPAPVGEDPMITAVK